MANDIDYSKVKFTDLKYKYQRVAYLRAAMANSAKHAIAGLMRIYANQTAGEQEMGATVEDNGIGFTGADADFLTSLAQSYEKYGRLTGDKESGQMKFVFKKMPKYAAQLESVSAPYKGDK